MIIAKNYISYSLNNFIKIPQIEKFLTPDQIHSIIVVGNVLPFKVNNYVVEELIDWTNVPHDPIFQLTFPQREMLSVEHFDAMENALRQNISKSEIKLVANRIRTQLNPNPDGQEYNVPTLNGVKINGIQHKYDQTVLFFPSNGQTCHAYCTFCFRWTQFVNGKELKFAMKESDLLVEYLRQNPEATDVLITGGDPMIMSAKCFAAYIDQLLDANLPNLQTIRIGTKSLAYWPYKFLTDNDSEEMIQLFTKIVDRGYNLAFMAHFNHPNELKSNAVKEAIKVILRTGAQIRTQSPILKHINDRVEDWKTMWTEQVKLGCIPYYMFIARDTGAQNYFAVTLDRALNVYQRAYREVSGIARTVRGPSMSADPGKIQILGINQIGEEKVFTCRYIQSRDKEKVGEPFFVKYDSGAIWIDDLVEICDFSKIYETEVEVE
jgi:KamA family protein